ncbi:MAG TPA: hypothetical protein DIV40_09380 [Clostridiales bacterium]|nr:hypothetical protein [Clostridiales bacterium]
MLFFRTISLLVISIIKLTSSSLDSLFNTSIKDGCFSFLILRPVSLHFNILFNS